MYIKLTKTSTLIPGRILEVDPQSGGLSCIMEQLNKGLSGSDRLGHYAQMWKEWDAVDVDIHYLCTWIGAKGVGWPHHRLGVHHSGLCHHHGAHVRRLMGEEPKRSMDELHFFLNKQPKNILK